MNESFIRIEETVIKNSELMIWEISDVKSQAITSCISSDLFIIVKSSLVSQLLQWEETSQEIITNESEKSEMKTDVADSICSNISVEKLSIISKIECFSDVNVLTNLVIVQTEQLDTWAENLDVWDVQSWSISQFLCAVTVKIETYFKMMNCSVRIRFESVKDDILKLYSSNTSSMLETDLKSKQSTY